MSPKDKIKTIKDYFFIVSGSLLTAISINVFLLPYKIAPGGVSGIGTIIYYLSDGWISVGLTMLILNVPLFIAGIRFVGKRFIVRTMFATAFLSLAIDSLAPFTNYFIENYILRFKENSYPPDILLYSIFGGFIMGIGLGLVFKSGATTGGTDLAAKILNHFVPSLTIGQLLLFIDTGVIVFAAIVFESFQLALYAILTLYISTKVIDTILEGVNYAKALFIISDYSDEIAKRILYDIDRGVTSLKGTGIYTGKEKSVLLCVLHRGQLPIVKRIVSEVDRRAFIILTDIREVLGEGFKTYD